MNSKNINKYYISQCNIWLNLSIIWKVLWLVKKQLLACCLLFLINCKLLIIRQAINNILSVIYKVHDFLLFNTNLGFFRTIFTETILSEWDLVCDKQYLADLAQTITMLGILFGNMVFGYLSDKWVPSYCNWISYNILKVRNYIYPKVKGFQISLSSWN